MSAITYLLQVSGCMAVFYLFYYFFLTRLTFFTINRYYLLVTLVLSFVIPAVTISVHEYTPVILRVAQINNFRHLTKGVVVAEAKKAFVRPTIINWLEILKAAYLLIAAGLLFRLIIMMVNFFAGLKNKQIKRVGNIRIIHDSKKLNNGSFLNYIFLDDESLNPDEIKQVIAHELLHVKLMHSFDRILIKIIQIILWFNPFAYFYARSIEENHEFEVDRELTRSTNKKAYADLLLHLQIASNGAPFNNFSTIPLKKRIMMLFNKPSAKIKKSVYVLTLPVLVLSCMAFATIKKDSIYYHNAYKLSKLFKQIKVDGTSLNKITINKIAPNVKPKVVADNLIKEEPLVNELQTESDTTSRFSVINGLDRLGPHPLVLIDSIEYSSDILYKISKACFAGTALYSPQGAFKKFGEKAKDGCIEIKTKKGKIVYMQPYEQENLAKESTVSKDKFLTRLHLKSENGKLYDKMIMQFPHGSATIEISHNGKVAFFIDTTFYDEDTFQKLPPEKIASLHGEAGVRSLDQKKHPNVNLHGYEAAFTFQSISTGKTLSNDEKYPWEHHLPSN